MKILPLITVMGALFIYVGYADASPQPRKISVNAYDCQSLQCVRQHIDVIDKKIASLLGQRLCYVKRAGELKKNQDSIHDKARESQIIASVRQQATQEGYPSSIAAAVFKTILAQSNAYERAIHQESIRKTN